MWRPCLNVSRAFNMHQPRPLNRDVTVNRTSRSRRLSMISETHAFWLTKLPPSQTSNDILS